MFDKNESGACALLDPPAGEAVDSSTGEAVDPFTGEAFDPPTRDAPHGEGAAGEPDPFDISEDYLRSLEPGAVDADVLDDIGDRIAGIAACLHAGTSRFLLFIAHFDRLKGWVPGGHKTCAHWLAYRTGLDPGTAREHVRVARSLEALPKTAEAMGRGALSFSQVRALSRIARPSNEEDLLELAEGCTAAQLERLVRAWKKSSREDEEAWVRELHRSRKLSVFPDDCGMYVIHGLLDPEVGVLLQRGLEAASDELYRRDPTPREALDADREAERRRADAIGLLVERAFVAGFGSVGDGGSANEADGVDSGTATNGATEDTTPICGTRAERYQVVLHVERETLAAEGEPGRSELEDGTRVSAETSRRLSCDASVVRIEHAVDQILNVGRRTRTIPVALRRALETRDRGCRFPGCHSRFTDAHHRVHWADGGETSLANTVLLCSFHHRLVHEGGWQVAWIKKGEAAFRDPRGSLHVAGRGQYRPPKESRLLATLVRVARQRGASPDGRTLWPRWTREADIPDGVLFRAYEASL